MRDAGSGTPELTDFRIEPRQSRPYNLLWATASPQTKCRRQPVDEHRRAQQLGVHHTSSRTLSARTVRAFLLRLGVPFASDSANFVACSTLIFGGIGGSNGSTIASTMTGPGVANACSSTPPHCFGSATLKPAAPHARAYAAKSIGCSSQPYSGLPRNTICSHLIIPSVLFLTMTTSRGRRSFTPVAGSAISREKPPSPTNATTCRSGCAIWAAIAYGSPLAI